MAFIKNEVILDSVRSLNAYDFNGEMLFRLTSLEDPSLQCTAEGEEVTDAIGALITTLYRAKKATFSATNSLISLDLAAAQYGAKKEVASADNKIVVPTFETFTVEAGTTEITLSKTPVGEVKYIYSFISNDPATRYTAASVPTATEFVIEGAKITLPTDLTGKVYVEYDYESENANVIVNKTSEFPEACKIKIFAYFRDKCNENLVYSGVIISEKAKLNPEQVELTLTATGKHAFEFQMMRDYCDEEAELFRIIIAE